MDWIVTETTGSGIIWVFPVSARLRLTDGSRERHIAGRSECESGNREAFTASVIHRSGKTANMMMKTDADILTV